MGAEPTTEKPRILLDCDPGLDDAIAILCAAYHADLVGITTVNGNVGIDLTTHNALVTTQIADLDVPVHRGAARPLIAPTMDAARVHGETGLGHVDLPTLERTVASADATVFISDMARTVDNLRLVAVGPLTNVALALRRDPALTEHLDGITIMGGAAKTGNTTPRAEFNVWADPEAAAVVFAEAAPITMVGLDVTNQVLLGPAEAELMRAAATPASLFAADLLDYAYQQCVEVGRPASPIHDATAIIAVTHPYLFLSQRHPVSVELRGEHTRGMTVVDDRAKPDHGTENNVVWSAEGSGSHTPHRGSGNETQFVVDVTRGEVDMTGWIDWVVGQLEGADRNELAVAFFLVWGGVILVWIALDWFGNPNRGGFKPQGPRRGRGLSGRWQAFRQSRELSEIDTRETLRTAYGRSSLRIMWSRLDETTATAFDEARLPEVPRLVESGTVVLHRPPALDDDTDDVFDAKVTSPSLPSTRWRVGLDPSMAIGGRTPSDRTIRSRAWKNLAHTHGVALGATNRDRATRGAPPRRWNPITARNETARLTNENGEFVITWSNRGVDPFQRLETADDL